MLNSLKRQDWRIEPHYRASAAVASGIDGDQRDRRCVIAQAALALAERPAQLRFRVIEALTT